MDSGINLTFSQQYIVDSTIEPRSSMDPVVNQCGHTLLDTCISTGLRIVNGRHGMDNGIGKLTCNNSRGGSVVDYLLIDQLFFENMKFVALSCS